MEASEVKGRCMQAFNVLRYEQSQRFDAHYDSSSNCKEEAKRVGLPHALCSLVQAMSLANALMSWGLRC